MSKANTAANGTRLPVYQNPYLWPFTKTLTVIRLEDDASDWGLASYKHWLVADA